MFVPGISAHGTTAIRFVPYSAKVTSVFYISKVLKALFSKDIPRLFGKDTKFAVLHHDSAPAHKAAATVQWLESHDNFIPEQDWCANSPDLSPMDYSINGIFKQGLWKRKAQDINELKRAMRQEWSSISKELCVETLKSWESRVGLMLDNNGLQIEYLK